jgi:glycosyltransferase involved in cell wall biosynthesis
MKISVYSKPFFPSLGGLERNTHTLCSALTDIGHEVHLVTETRSKEKDGFPFDVTRTSSLRTIGAIVGDTDMLLINGGVSLKVLPFALLQQVNYGIIYHNYLAFRREGNAWYSVRLRQWMAERAVVNIFTSNHSRKLAGLTESSCHVLLNPVDIELQKHYRSSRDKTTRQDSTHTFLFAGRLIEGKGVFVLMDALERIDQSGKKIPSLRMVYAGTGPAMPALKRRAAKLERVRVELPGRMDAASLVHMYEDATALIVPSTTHKEGNPLVIAESLYAGTPVIASDQPPMVESVGKAGIIFPEGEVEALSDAMQTILKQDGAWEVMSSEARRRKRLFTYEHYAREMDNILNHETGG